MIIDERMSAFIDSLDSGNPAWLNEIEKFALETQVPIIRRSMQSLLKFLLKFTKPKSILEVGTAIGFSALLMSEYAPGDCHITTIEKYEKRIPIAKENFRKAGREDRITLLEGDATEILRELEGTYDVIFMDGLLYAEDIPTLQEFIGYCLIPSNKGQRMMVIKGNGGEGKSQIGAVLSAIFGTNMKDGSIGKISENRFARADLEHILLCVDDDMRMEALRQTNYVKSIVTAQGKMDLERKGKQSYQGWMFARLLAFSNGDLQALYDRSDGFYRRQLVLTTKEKPTDRADDPDLAEKMKTEAEGIFLWALEGLQRLVANNFQFTESDRIRENREAVKRDNNNIFDFMESEGYIRRKADASISSKDFYEIYRMWCEENSLAPLKARSFSDAMIANAKKFNLEHCNNITNSAGRRVWGFMGVEAVARPHINGFYGNSPCTYVPEDIPEEWRQVE